MKKIYNKSLKNSSKQWISRQINDPLVRKAKIYGYRSRSAFKLIELDNKFHILKKGKSLLDLGSAPGGWSQVAVKKIKDKILAVDIDFMEKIQNVEFILGNFLEPTIKKKIKLFFNEKIDIIVSDMASNTTGNKDLDSFKTSELCFNALEFSKENLDRKGTLICKIFMGSAFQAIEKKAKDIFSTVIKYKPNSSRKESRELYLFCKNLIN